MALNKSTDDILGYEDLSYKSSVDMPVDRGVFGRVVGEYPRRSLGTLFRSSRNQEDADALSLIRHMNHIRSRTIKHPARPNGMASTLKQGKVAWVIMHRRYVSTLAAYDLLAWDAGVDAVPARLFIPGQPTVLFPLIIATTAPDDFSFDRMVVYKRAHEVRAFVAPKVGNITGNITSVQPKREPETDLEMILSGL